MLMGGRSAQNAHRGLPEVPSPGRRRHDDRATAVRDQAAVLFVKRRRDHAGSEDVLEGLRRLGRLVVVNGNAPSDSRYPTTIEGTIGRWRLGMVHNLDKQRARWAAG